MRPLDPPLIVGAGPVGLGAALLLARRGRAARVVERREGRSRQSRALAVNPRTLEILEPTGVTARMLEQGMPIRGVQIHRTRGLAAEVSLAGIHPDYPFMLALSQAATERLLAGALEEAGGRVERGLELVGCRAAGDGVEAELDPAAGGPRQVVRCPWLLAADGAHSTVRRELGIDLEGSALGGAWHLADAPLATDLAADRAHVVLLEGGEFQFLLRVVDPELVSRGGGPVWRVLGNRPEPLSRLVRGEPAGEPVWESSFDVPHRIAATLATGGVYLAGDAAHVHSPVGARGMNLGLEDAWVFAELERAGRLADYHRLRYPVDRRVVRRVELVSRLVSAESRLLGFARRFLFPLLVRVPLARRRLLATVAGLDHELPAIGAGRPPRPHPPSRPGAG